MNIMDHDGYKARIEYDPEGDRFRGEILGLNGVVDFFGKNTRELHSEFRKSLRVFLEVCDEKGVEPRRTYSGKFNLRVSGELHEKIAARAAAEGISLNAWIAGVLTESV